MPNCRNAQKEGCLQAPNRTKLSPANMDKHRIHPESCLFKFLFLKNANMSQNRNIIHMPCNWVLEVSDKILGQKRMGFYCGGRKFWYGFWWGGFLWCFPQSLGKGEANLESSSSTQFDDTFEEMFKDLVTPSQEQKVMDQVRSVSPPRSAFHQVCWHF